MRPVLFLLVTGLSGCALLTQPDRFSTEPIVGKWQGFARAQGKTVATVVLEGTLTLYGDEKGAGSLTVPGLLSNAVGDFEIDWEASTTTPRKYGLSARCRAGCDNDKETYSFDCTVSADDATLSCGDSEKGGTFTRLPD